MLAVTSMYQSDFLSVTRWFEMTEKTQKLKPCPFCGSGDIEILTPYPKKDDSALIYCFGCDLRIPKNSTPEAIAAWNRRAPQCEKE